MKFAAAARWVAGAFGTLVQDDVSLLQSSKKQESLVAQQQVPGTTNGLYFWSSGDRSNTCPTHFAHLTVEDDCKEAAKAHGLKYNLKEENQWAPLGCYSMTGQDRNVYFNELHTPTFSGYDECNGCQLICKNSDSPTANGYNVRETIRSNDCAPGFTHILDETTCKTAAEALKLGYQKAQDNPLAPLGCWWQGRDQVYFNDRHINHPSFAGFGGSTDGQLICKTAPSSSVNSVINVYMDGVKAQDVKRQEVLSGFVSEMLYEFDASSFTVTESNISIPFNNAPLHGKFYREAHVFGMNEWGNVIWRLGYNPVSSIPHSLVGIVEKLKTTKSYPNVWPRDSEYQRKADLKGRTDADKASASSNRELRDQYVLGNVASNKLGPQLVLASLDKNHVTALMGFAIFNASGNPSSYINGRIDSMQTMASKVSSTQTIIYSQSNCFHISKSGPLFTASPNGMTLPSNKKLVSFKGESMFSPVSKIGILSGMSVWSIKGSKVNVYWAASSMSDMFDPLVAGTTLLAAFYIGRVDGESSPMLPEGRVQPFAPNHPIAAYNLSRQMYDLARDIPIDYEFLYKDESAMCTEARYSTLTAQTVTLDLMGWAMGSTKYPNDVVIGHMAQSLNCGVGFLRADAPNSNGFDVIEAIVWNHLMMEAPQPRLATAKGWD